MTAKDVPWSAEEELDGESGSINNRYDRVEDLINNAMKRIAQKDDGSGGSRGINGSGSGTSVEGEGTGNSGGEVESAGEGEDNDED